MFARRGFISKGWAYERFGSGMTVMKNELGIRGTQMGPFFVVGADAQISKPEIAELIKLIDRLVL